MTVINPGVFWIITCTLERITLLPVSEAGSGDYLQKQEREGRGCHGGWGFQNRFSAEVPSSRNPKYRKRTRVHSRISISCLVPENKEQFDIPRSKITTVAAWSEIRSLFESSMKSKIKAFAKKLLGFFGLRWRTSIGGRFLMKTG